MVIHLSQKESSTCNVVVAQNGRKLNISDMNAKTNDAKPVDLRNVFLILVKTFSFNIKPEAFYSFSLTKTVTKKKTSFLKLS